jgi:hypothetical protein
MRTKFPFEINIDESKFKLEYKELNKNESGELIKEYGKAQAIMGQIQELKAQIVLLEEKKSIKKELASCQEGKDKAKTIRETLDLISRLEAKRNELNERESAEIDLDALIKKRFDLTVSGEDRAKFQAEIESKGLSYLSVMNAIDEAIEAERSKK